METQQEKDLRIWNAVKKFFQDHKEQLPLNEHNTNPPSDITGINAVYWRMLVSAQNRQRMSNFIKFNEPAEKWRRIFFNDFDPKKVFDEYAVNDEKLWNAIHYYRDENDNGKKFLMKTFVRAAIDSAIFLQTFDYDLDKLRNFLNGFPPSLKYVVPYIISTPIYGYGYALACDFLKECEELEFDIVKPDIHIKNFLAAIDNNPKENQSQKIKYTDPEIVKRMHQFVVNVGPIGFEDCFKWRTPGKTGDDYKLDKIIWFLFSSKKGPFKDEFLKTIQHASWRN